MNDRDKLVLRALLESLAAVVNMQYAEAVLHDSTNLRLRNGGSAAAVLSEFDRARDFADSHRWIMGVRTALGGVRWNITDRGRAALADFE